MHCFKSHHYEGELLRPHLHVNVEAKPINQNVKGLRDGIHLAHPVEYDVHGGDEDLPHAVEREEVAQEIEVFPLAAFRPVNSLAHILKVVQFQKKVLRELLQGQNVSSKEKE